MFAEVTHLSNRIKKRRLLSRFVHFQVPFLYQATYAFLYRLSFIRSSDFLSMYLRLTLIGMIVIRSEEHTSELQSRGHLVCRLLLEKKKLARRCMISGEMSCTRPPC